MALGTYSDLKTSIQSWMYDRTDLASVVDDFIDLCEGEMNRVLRTRQQITITTLTLDANSRAALPDDYLEHRRVKTVASPIRTLDLVTPNYRDDMFQGQSGTPQVFTLDGDGILVAPASASSEIEFEYFAAVPALSDAAPTNWLLTRFPNVYLFGSLKHAALFIGDQGRTQQMGTMFAAEIDAIKQDDNKALWARAHARPSGATP